MITQLCIRTDRRGQIRRAGLLVCVYTDLMRASDRAYRTLLDEIQSGALAAGTVLGEVEQAARLGVSRTPLREAVARLAADGLVVQQSPRVTVVSDLDADDIRELFELRRALEQTAARLAAARGDAATFAAFALEFDRTHRDAAPGTCDELFARFDAAIDAAAANDYVAAALRTVRAHLVRVRRLARENPDRVHAAIVEHRTIARAIAAGDGELAAHATHVHVQNALESILASLEAHVPADVDRHPRLHATTARAVTAEPVEGAA